MGELTASMEEIADAGAFAASKADEMDGKINSFSRTVDEFLSGDWKGQAADAFRGPFEDWTANAKKVQQSLAAMAELLGQAAQYYGQREVLNSDSLRVVGESVQGTGSF